jgi:hypothetical protein
MSTTYYFDGSTFSLKVTNPEDEDSTKDPEDEEENEKVVPKKRSTRKRKKTAKAMNVESETKENDESAIADETLDDQDVDEEKPPSKKNVKGKRNVGQPVKGVRSIQSNLQKEGLEPRLTVVVTGCIFAIIVIFKLNKRM